MSIILPQSSFRLPDSSGSDHFDIVHLSSQQTPQEAVIQKVEQVAFPTEECMSGSVIRVESQNIGKLLNIDERKLQILKQKNPPSLGTEIQPFQVNQPQNSKAGNIRVGVALGSDQAHAQALASLDRALVGLQATAIQEQDDVQQAILASLQGPAERQPQQPLSMEIDSCW